MPLYLFRCTACAAEQELLLPMGEIAERPCVECGEPARHRFARVGVTYNGWGFSATDSLINDTRGKNFTDLRNKADQLTSE